MSILANKQWRRHTKLQSIINSVTYSAKAAFAKGGGGGALTTVKLDMLDCCLTVTSEYGVHHFEGLTESRFGPIHQALVPFP